MTATRPTLAVWKFASCDGCQLAVLNCERELLEIAEAVEIRWFPEASSVMVDGPVDVSLVEGSISTLDELHRIRRIRGQSDLLVTIGACATGGGVQALRNGQDLDAFVNAVYATPEYISSLSTSTPISDHVIVDAELQGCPIDKRQLIELISALVAGRPPRLPTWSVCQECKANGTVCVMVAGGVPCLGPATMAGCGGLCPGLGRGCFGCFGPMENPNVAALDGHFVQLGLSEEQRARLLRGICDFTTTGR